MYLGRINRGGSGTSPSELVRYPTPIDFDPPRMKVPDIEIERLPAPDAPPKYLRSTVRTDAPPAHVNFREKSAAIAALAIAAWFFYLATDGFDFR